MSKENEPPNNPSIISQYINNLSVERYDIGNNLNSEPEVNISGNYDIENLDTQIPKIIIDVKLEVSYESSKALALELNYIANVNIKDVNPSDVNVFLYLEYPPILLLEIRNIISTITESSSIHRVVIDPWGLSRTIIDEMKID